MTKSAALFLLTFLVFGASAKEALKIVPNKDVCMVTNMYFARTQIPIEHSGKTYYGCCENCKKTLAEDAESRVATDPVTLNPVDKALAVIAAKDDGTVIYFANKDSLKKFSQLKDKN